MSDTRLFMLEGLPGTGKSTNSYYLYIQLERNQKKVKWIHEVTQPHPTLFFNEACLTFPEYEMLAAKYPKAVEILKQIAVFRKNTVGIDLLEIERNYRDSIDEEAFTELKKFDVFKFSIENYEKAALDKWAYFVEAALKEEDVIYILDSSILQFQIFTFLLKNVESEKLEQFMQKLIEIIKPLNPGLIYFYREQADNSISYLEKTRGIKYLEEIRERDKAEPYYTQKPQGAEGFRIFLRDYADFACSLFDSIDCRKLAVEITKQDWSAYELDILKFAGIKYEPDITAFPAEGTYFNEDLQAKIEIKGLDMKDPHGNVRKLTVKADREFYVECLPVVLQFDENGNILITGTTICERWTTTGTLFVKQT